DVRDKTKLSWERLKMKEAEKSSFDLENEQQRQLYKKCHHEIASQHFQELTEGS
ncbi:unnamed protein product, partial [Lymnaea stagnalis]